MLTIRLELNGEPFAVGEIINVGMDDKGEFANYDFRFTKPGQATTQYYQYEGTLIRYPRKRRNPWHLVREALGAGLHQLNSPEEK